MLRYKDGLRLTFPCYQCSHIGPRRQGTVFKQRIRWLAKLDCGHTKFCGYVAPPDELRAKGLLTKEKPDPRIAQAVAKQRDEVERERREFEARQEHFTRGKYL